MNTVLWLVGLFGVVWGYSWIWTKWVAGKVCVSMEEDRSQSIEVGDEVGVWMIVENRSWLAIPWLQLFQPLPEGLRIEDGGDWESKITYRTYLLPRQLVKRRLNIQCVSRGYHRFQRTEMTFGDGTGLRSIQEKVDTGAHLLVRPRLLNDTDVPVRLQDIVGEQSVVRWYQEDPSRLVGVRSYRRGDPYKFMHWAATARTGELMVKQFDTTSDTTVYIVLNVHFFDPHWLGSIKEIVEHQCRMAATLCEQTAQHGHSFSLYSNASWSSHAGQLVIPPGNTADHFQETLNALGELWPHTACTFTDLLAQLRGRLNNASTVIVLTAYWNDEATHLAEQLRSEGHAITIVAFNDMAKQLTHLHPAIQVMPIEKACSGEEEVESA